jgi:hypothetical protein
MKNSNNYRKSSKYSENSAGVGFVRQTSLAKSPKDTPQELSFLELTQGINFYGGGNNNERSFIIMEQESGAPINDQRFYQEVLTTN